MVAFALSEHWLEEEEFDDEDEEAFVFRFRFDRMSNLFLILVSDFSVGCWYGLACFFFLPPGGEKEFAKGGSVFLLGRLGKSTKDSVWGEILADSIKSALNG